MSNAPKVVGYKEISFWQEEGIGVITILSDDSGKVTLNFFEEFLKAVTLAITDDKVKTLAITGSNDNFLSGLRSFEASMGLNLIDMTSTLASFIAMLNKPVFSMINGKCSDLGVELALLSDVILCRKGINISMSEKYHPVMGMTKTVLKYPYFSEGEPREGFNCDKIISEESFLDDASKFIQDNSRNYLYMSRREKLGDINRILASEKASYLSNMLIP
jgi:hypothetical protein